MNFAPVLSAGLPSSTPFGYEIVISTGNAPASVNSTSTLWVISVVFSGGTFMPVIVSVKVSVPSV